MSDLIARRDPKPISRPPVRNIPVTGVSIPVPQKPVWFPQDADFYFFYTISGPSKQFYCLRGGTPIMTGGGAKIQTIDRDRQTGLTVFTGYDPVMMDVPIWFENYADGTSLENDIAALIWMQGRGPGAAATQPKKDAPIVVISAYNAGGDLVQTLGQTFDFSEKNNPNPPSWLITNVSWDGDALYNHAAHRVRQRATVSITQWVPTPSGDFGVKDTGAGSKTVTHHSTERLNTIGKLANHWRNTKEEIRKANNYGKNKRLDPYLRDLSKKLKPGTAVKVYRK